MHLSYATSFQMTCNHVPGDDVYINMDETVGYFDMPSKYTIDFKGVKTVRMQTTGGEKLCYTAVLAAGVHRKNGNEWQGFSYSIT